MAAGRTGCSGSRGNHPWGDTNHCGGLRKAGSYHVSTLPAGLWGGIDPVQSGHPSGTGNDSAQRIPAESSGRRLCGQHYDNRNALWGCERAVYQ